MDLVVSIFSQVLLALAVPYCLITVALGIRVARRGGGLRAQETVAGTTDASDAPDYHLYVLVPCLNEALVIGATVHRLLSEDDCTVVVIDDDSDDDTAGEARRAAEAIGAGHQLMIHRRRAPDARLGKGKALNAAFPLVVEDAARRGLSSDRVIVGVMDADGRLSKGGARAAMSQFDDERIGAVQLIVRIRNRRKLIAQFQDVEFWMISAIFQFARTFTGTVSLGGNGQLTRLSALQDLEGEPWSQSLTEDLDLGLRLAADGWRITTTTTAYVDQQGVESYRRLLRQRTRWYQGHMSCIRRVPELWSSEKLGQVGLIELTAYLLVPWVIVLPWSVIQQWVLYQLIFGSGHGVFATGLSSTPMWVMYAVLWYVVSFLPNLVIGFVYARRTRAVPWWRALLLGHLMIVWNYIGYAAAWRGLVRILRGRHGWEKTTRTVEDVAVVGNTVTPASTRATTAPDRSRPSAPRRRVVNVWAVVIGGALAAALVRQVLDQPSGRN